MGWTGDTTALYGIRNITKKFLDNYFQNHNSWNSEKYKVLATSYRNGVYYEAVRELATGKVFAGVTLIKRNGTELLFKEMSEDMGPCEDHPSKTVLNLLTPTDSEYAMEWRKRARKNLERTSLTINIGDTVHLSEEFEYQDGYSSNTFTIGRFGRQNYHFIGENGKHYRAPKRWREFVTEVNGVRADTKRGELVTA